MFEHLHIDFAKEGWHTTNQQDAFPQIIKWLSQQEKMYAFEIYTSWINSQHVAPPPALTPSLAHNTAGNLISHPKYPTQPHWLLHHIEQHHFMPGFSATLKEYLNCLVPSPISSCKATSYTLPFQKLDVYHTFKFHPPSFEDDIEECDVIKAAPATKKKQATLILLWFWTLNPLNPLAWKFHLIIFSAESCWYQCLRDQDWPRSFHFHTSRINRSQPMENHHRSGLRHHWHALNGTPDRSQLQKKTTTCIQSKR